jgi:flagellar export protein FliJ
LISEWNKEDKRVGSSPGYLARLEHEKGELIDLKQKRAGLLDQMCEKSSNSIQAADLIQYSNYLQHLQRNITNKEKSLCKTVKDVEYCREKLIEISVGQRIMEKLKERCYLKFRHQLERQRERGIEEVVNHRMVSN